MAESDKDEAALVASHLDLARRVARRYAGKGEPMDDLVQVARVGLVKAARRYEPDRGHDFASYAVPTMLGEIRRYFRDACWTVRVPRGLQELSLRVGATTDRLSRELGRSPTAAEVAVALDVSEDEVLEALESSWAYNAESLDAPLHGGDDSASLADRLTGDESSLDDVDARESLRRVLGGLPARERRILTLRFFGERTQGEIAQELGISQMHVSRLLSRTLTRLREHLVDGAPLPEAWTTSGGQAA